jgi:hypothetical protein
LNKVLDDVLLPGRPPDDRADEAGVSVDQSRARQLIAGHASGQQLDIVTIHEGGVPRALSNETDTTGYGFTQHGGARVKPEAFPSVTWAKRT